jgi:hypothetical protein
MCVVEPSKSFLATDNGPVGLKHGSKSSWLYIVHVWR